MSGHLKTAIGEWIANLQGSKAVAAHEPSMSRRNRPKATKVQLLASERKGRITEGFAAEAAL
jgi:hypothetical protein